MPVGGILGLQGRKLQHYLDYYKVMTSMNMIMQQAVYKSTINSIFQIRMRMRAVDQKLKINLVWPYCYGVCSSYRNMV